MTIALKSLSDNSNNDWVLMLESHSSCGFPDCWSFVSDESLILYSFLKPEAPCGGVVGGGGHPPAGPRLGGLRQACFMAYQQMEALCILYICLSPDVILSFSNPKVIQISAPLPGSSSRRGR